MDDNYQVLDGCRLLFSRLWHVGLKNEDQHLWSLAIDLGASCTTETDDSVTHLVTSTTLTEKVSLLQCTVTQTLSSKI